MDFIFNYVFAWVTVVIAVYLSLKYVIRKLATSHIKNKSFFQKLNKSSRKHHIWLGIVMCVTGLIHGLFSSDKLLSFNFGTLLLVVALLLGGSYAIRKRFAHGKTWLVVHRFLTVSFLALMVVHIVDVGGIGIFDEVAYMSQPRETMASLTETPTQTAATPIETPTQTAAIEQINANLFGVVLKDGTYQGIANAYGPDLTVDVVVSNNQVTNITVVSHNENKPRFYATPIAEIPTSIVAAQSLDVDTITGATFTSVGIINAVNEALSQAVVSGTLPDMLALPQNRH